MGMLSSDPRPVINCDPELGAQQHFKEECDINNIMRKYVQTGLITHVSENQGRFADVSMVGSYHEAVQRVKDTREFFMKLPVKMRAEFLNDPSLFLDFIADPGNLEDLEQMGLQGLQEAVKDPGPPPVKEEVVEPVVEGSESD